MDPWSLFLGIVLSSCGMGYFIYGKRQQHILALCCGVLLCGIPYFIDSVPLLLLLSIPLLLAPWFIKP